MNVILFVYKFFVCTYLYIYMYISIRYTTQNCHFVISHGLGNSYNWNTKFNYRLPRFSILPTNIFRTHELHTAEFVSIFVVTYGPTKIVPTVLAQSPTNYTVGKLTHHSKLLWVHNYHRRLYPCICVRGFSLGIRRLPTNFGLLATIFVRGYLTYFL
jgi:hypothetical protein